MRYLRMDTTKLRSNILLQFGVLLLLSFGYFFLIGYYVLCFQETQSLFIFSTDYFGKFVIKPGGLLEYTGKFLTQFYVNRFLGPLIVSIVISVPTILIWLINRKVSAGRNAPLFFVIAPSLVLLVMQANYYHLMEYNIGFISILLYFLVSVSSGKKYFRILTVILWPLFYFFAGAYALLFILLFVVHSLIDERQGKFIVLIITVLVVGLTLFLSVNFIFLQPLSHIFFFPLPVLENFIYKLLFILLCVLIIGIPAVCSGRFALKNSFLKGNFVRYSAPALLVILAGFLLFRIYNPQTARVLEMERLIFNERWDEAIKLQERHPARNLIGEYFYNVALSETDQLCDRLFKGRQDFGAGSLVLPWGDEHLNRGAYFYYSIGLTNEAHRWAYEEMVVYGYRPQNIKLLIKTCLINGDIRMAGKYIGILKKTLFYRRYSERFEKMADNPELIKNDRELAGKMSILPGKDFFIQFNEPQNNLPLILEGQPENTKAFEYYLAGLLLTKNVEAVAGSLNALKTRGYVKIPRFIEEAIMIYYNSTKTIPDLGGMEVSSDTRERFQAYFNAYVEARKDPSTLQVKMKQKFGDTFWYYYHFM
jgi:hypothetical protein